MYEVFVNEDNKVIESGNILFANLILTGEDNSLYYFDKDGDTGHYDKNEEHLKSINENTNQWCKIIISIWNEKASN